MSILEFANDFHAIRQNSGWASLDDTTKLAALARADDYIRAHYLLPVLLAEDAQLDRDRAQSVLALEMVTVQSVRATTAIVKEAKEGAGFKKSVEYADAPLDPYPIITAMLLRHMVRSQPASYYSGMRAL